VIDKSLSALDERLESVAAGVKAVGESMAPLLSSSAPETDDLSDRALLVRKYSAFTADWEAVQQESEVLREELKEDKWLTVFRTVTEQADGMMSSLEKAVNRCQVRAPPLEAHMRAYLNVSRRTLSGRCIESVRTTCCSRPPHQ